MRLDMHVHTKEGSFDSELPVEQALRKARERGLAGLCITDHESLALRTEAERLSERFGLLVLVGMEYLTTDGDVLVFGLDSVPRGPLSAPELAAHVTSQGGVSVAAHPFRNNGRGMGALFSRVPLHAVESFNGSTLPKHNLQAEALAAECCLPRLGGSDAHLVERIGLFATEFRNTLRNERDLLEALRNGAFRPVAWNGREHVDALPFVLAQNGEIQAKRPLFPEFQHNRFSA